MSRVEELLTSEESGRRGVSAWWKLGIAGAAILLLVLAIFLPPLVNLGKYRRSITASMSEALGRPVYVGDMQLRLLPMPGIVMSDFTVEEDPAFGAEPALHANSVVASLRLTSLWRGRLEVSRISLDEANLNLVRNAAGQWSVGSMLLRAAQIPNAPTGQRHAGPRPRFPYIEATDARIDFKNGAEKRPFSLMNAEFSMWQASADEWRLRLKAQPVRTDLELHLSDTGTLQVEGSLRRAADVNEMPVRLRAEWSGAQLGQVSRLLAGFDSGWRGDLDATTSLGGTVGDLQLQTRLTVSNLRRQDFQPVRTLDVNATCRGEYRHSIRTLGNVTCFLPVGDGHLLLTGNVHTFAPTEAQLQLEVNQVPAEFPLEVLGLMRSYAQNVTATGALNGSFRLDLGKEPSVLGQAKATGVVLNFPGETMALPTLELLAGEAQRPPAKRLRGARTVTKAPVREPDAIELQPVAIAMGGAGPLKADGSVDRSGFHLQLSGQASVARLMAVGSNFGLLENALALAAPKGRVAMDTTTTGNWLPPLMGSSSGIVTTGVLHVEGLELREGFLRAPVEVASADVELKPGEVAWQKAALRYGGMELQGSGEYPAVCSQAGACPVTFAVTAGSLNAAKIETLLAGQPQGIFGEILTSALGEGSRGPWPPVRGTVEANSLELGKLTVQNVAASVTVDGKKLTIASLEGGALGGKLQASGTMDASSGTPQWALNVRVTGASLADAGKVFGESWGTGTGAAEAKLTMSGYAAADLASSASGTFQFAWQNGGLPGVSRVSQAGGQPGGQPGLGHFDHWSATGTIGNGALTVTDGGVTRAGRTEAVRGTIGFNRSVNLTMETRHGRVRIGGSLGHESSR
ncbi:MAG: AsmA family protein [Acidobacteriaceae bacterium]